MTEPETAEPRIKVIDRRRLIDDSPPVEAASQVVEADPEVVPDEAEADDDEAEDAHLPSVPELLGFFIAELSMRAFVNLGLIANPATGLVAADPPQARLAIDATAGLIEALSPHLPPSERDELRRMLGDLRMNFVQRAGASPAPTVISS